MIRVLACCMCLCAMSMTASAQQTVGADRAPDDVERRWFTVTTEPEVVLTQGAYVGGELVMDIRFVSSDPFKRLRLALPQIDGARTKTLIRPHTLQINMFGGKGYSHEARLAIVPQRPGTLVIPPISVSGISQPQGGRSVEFEETHPEQRITVHGPSPDFAGAAWVVSRRAVIEESWAPDITAIHSGDTVRRRVVLTVAGVTADDLPELTLESNDGYRVLNSEVSAETEKTETGFVAHLEQSWNIYIETDDVTYIDAIGFPYWNPALAKTEVVSVPRQRVEPLLKDAAQRRQQLREGALGAHRTKRLGLMALLALPIVGLVALLAVALWYALPTQADLRLWRASRQAGSPLEFYGSFLSWVRQTLGPSAPVEQQRGASLGGLAADQVEHMHQAIFGKRGGEFDARRTALRLIWASRRMNVMRFVSRIVPGMSRLLFLR